MRILNLNRNLRGAFIAAMLLVLACFTTACQPLVVEAAAAEAVTRLVSASDTDQESAQTETLLHFDGHAKGVVDGSRIIVTDENGAKHQFTWVDEGVRAHSAPIPQGTYATPAEVALRAAEVAVTISGNAVPSCEIHINMYTGDGLELVYYGICFGGTPFEPGEIAYGYADAVTGTVLLLDTCNWGETGNDNAKVPAFDWSNERYAAVHTSQKALATAMELVRTCFPTGEIVAPDPTVWDAGSHTDGEQISWSGGYVALVDAYIRMDTDPCYYVQVAVPLEEGAKPRISIFGCYPLGWEYCCNQMHDPAILQEEQAELEAIRKGTLSTDDVPMPTPTPLPRDVLETYAEQAEAYLGTRFTPSALDWKRGDDPAEYEKIFLVRVGAYLDDGYESSEHMSNPAQVAAAAKRGNVLCFASDSALSYAVYVGDGQIIFADPSTMTVCSVSIAEWMQSKPDCTCWVLTW